MDFAFQSVDPTPLTSPRLCQHHELHMQVSGKPQPKKQGSGCFSRVSQNAPRAFCNSMSPVGVSRVQGSGQEGKDLPINPEGSRRSVLSQQSLAVTRGWLRTGSSVSRWQCRTVRGHQVDERAMPAAPGMDLLRTPHRTRSQ